MTYDDFISRFTANVQPHIQSIQSSADKQESKRLTLLFILFALVTSVFIVSQQFNINNIFVFFAFFIAIFIYYVGNYALSYDYMEHLEEKIFSNVIASLGDDCTFTHNDDMKEKIQSSGMFLLFNVVLLSSISIVKWCAKFKYQHSLVTFSFIEIDMTSIEQPYYHSIATSGYFATITHLSIGEEAFYVSKKHLIPSPKYFVKNTQAFEMGNYTIFSSSLPEKTRNTIEAIVSLFDEEITLSYKNNLLCIFVHSTFDCFNTHNYTSERMPTLNNFQTLFETKNRLKCIAEQFTY